MYDGNLLHDGLQLLSLSTSVHQETDDLGTCLLQELLRRYGATEQQPAPSRRSSRESTPTESNSLFLELPTDIQDVVRPYLESKFQLASTATAAKGVIFLPEISFRRWLYLWMRQLVVHYASGAFQLLLCL